MYIVLVVKVLKTREKWRHGNDGYQEHGDDDKDDHDDDASDYAADVCDDYSDIDQ